MQEDAAGVHGHTGTLFPYAQSVSFSNHGNQGKALLEGVVPAGG